MGTDRRYLVTWELEVEGAADPREAAERAWATMRRPGSIANVFVVIEPARARRITRVDLGAPADTCPACGAGEAVGFCGDDLVCGFCDTTWPDRAAMAGQDSMYAGDPGVGEVTS